ncbi:MAG: aldehyde dehydrogenase family protein, partial [Mycobacterium sp.]|nr:aldehyde dehydrogenase family protein [Mycobacterium sp.]
EEVANYFDPTEMTAVTGGPEVGAAFSSLPFDHLFFTGSAEIGKLVASAAATNLVPVTLELGGKNPAVIAKDADIAAMARRVMAARICNGGQICLCPEYAFVPRDRLNEFVDAALGTARSAATADEGDGLIAIINDKNYQRVKALIDDAQSLGATILDTGTPFDPARRRIPPTVLLDVNDDMLIANSEVFGPVLSVLPYDTIEQVVDYVTSRPTPLAAYWYGPVGGDFEHFRAWTASGGMTVNDFAIHCAMMGAPFGGLGYSGWGAYHGKAGFDTFTHRRTVTVSRLPVSFARLMTPPYPAALKPAISSYIGFERWRATRRRARRA